jgi:Zn ribbon nucleic-acid-binding protein
LQFDSAYLHSLLFLKQKVFFYPTIVLFGLFATSYKVSHGGVTMLKEELQVLVDAGSSIAEMSSSTGKSKTTIRYWLKKFDLKTKNAIHNKKLKHECKFCGETDREKMMNKGRGRKSYSVCKICHNKKTVERGRQKKIDLVNHMGGECVECGYNKNYAALEIHHLDETKKDPDFQGIRYWSFERAKAELENCVLLCSNCHRERHNPDFIPN